MKICKDCHNDETSKCNLIIGNEWRYEPEFITERQVAALNELLTLPLVPDLDFEFREHE